MRHLNYSHLQYFWAIVREGSIVKASQTLHLTPQTISGQIRQLEESVGVPLFNRVGRRLELTETGTIVYQYANEIFTIGAELAGVVRAQQFGERRSLNVGVVNSMPKIIAQRIIAPALEHEAPRLRCAEDSLDRLLGDLAVHRLDLVLSDQSVPTGLSLKLYPHRLGESGMSFFASRRNARRYRKHFPDRLSGAPLLMPAQNSPLRRRQQEW